MSIVRYILNKSDNLMKEAYESDNIKGYGKSFLSGVIDGFVDYTFVMGTACIIKMIYSSIKKIES